MTTYAATPEAWRKVAEVCFRAGLCGLDTETYGHDLDKTTAPYRARVHVWSLAVLTEDTHPRGHHVSVGVVLPRDALLEPSIREMLGSAAVIKVAHNAPHDIHSLNNEGVPLVSVLDSLPRARVMFPTWQRHGLKTLCKVVGRELRKYEDVLTMDVDEPRPCKVCVCGDPECKRRNKQHTKIDGTKYVTRPALQPLESVVPGHKLWADLVEYAAEDAVTAIELWDYMDRMVRPTPLPQVPWCPEWREYENVQANV